jgi:hypothetical protein
MRVWANSGADTPLIWVTARDGSEGTFQLSGRFEPVPANDLCAGATVLDVSSGSASINGDIVRGFPDNDDRCSTLSDASLYYQFAAAKSSSYRVRLVPTSFDAKLSVFGACGSTCVTSGPANAAGVGVAEELTVSTSNTAQTFRIGVHSGTVFDAGDFTLSVTKL